MHSKLRLYNHNATFTNSRGLHIPGARIMTFSSASRILSLGVASLYMMLSAANSENLLACLGIIPGLTIPLGLIWFSDVVSRMDEWGRRGRDITDRAPGVMFIIMGWIILALPLLPVVLYLLDK